jgi:hypothetical protein
VIRRLEKDDKLETARKVRWFMSRVFAHSVGLGWRDRNPIPDLPKAKHTRKADREGLPGLTDPAAVGALLRAIDGYMVSWRSRRHCVSCRTCSCGPANSGSLSGVKSISRMNAGRFPPRG